MSSSDALRVVEFYSGIGGMHYALRHAGLNAQVIRSFDINHLANATYLHNFSLSPSTTAIERLSVKSIDDLGADMFLLSPPCQPYTRGGNQRGNADLRAKSLQHLLSVFPQMKRPPAYLLLENVKGFEESDSYEDLIRTLTDCQYSIQHFLLSPTQYGIPNHRLRYYCLAKRKPLAFVREVEGLAVQHRIPLIEEKEPLTLEDLLHLSTPREDRVVADLKVPSSFFKDNNYRHEVVWGKSRTTGCFTKGYPTNYKGAGSLLLDLSLAQDDSLLSSEISSLFEPSSSSAYVSDLQILRALPLRFFSPREVAELHRFPEDFGFPSTVSRKQQYGLLGNSLCVEVVALLIQYLLLSPPQHDIH
eukprot:TRINITY_DN8161_c0_g1_i1.p1 TRINITY_DN8161_c0_g1~~TRINITY_DN8161_c0_g1_i1.p1  ORF type:complete len:360 (+),score=63.48 TRINITY_DN8161_c0_g1_i1:61-1140(+)